MSNLSVSLKKGQKVNISKSAEIFSVGLGWDACDTPGRPFDLDAWALAYDSKIGYKPRNLVYFGNRCDPYDAIKHCGDNLTGDGDGDDETIIINTKKLPNTCTHILIGVTIFRAASRKESFGEVNNTFIRIYDTNKKTEICKYADEFKNEFAGYATVLFGALVRVPNGWEFIAKGEGSKVGSISQVVNVYKTYKLNTDLNTKQESGGKKVMAVSLSKGGKVSLAKVAADAGIQGGLKNILIGLGWDTNRYSGGAQFDLDAAAFLTGANGKVRNEKDFVFYNNLKGDGVEHTGDNRTGDGEGDDEQIKVDLTQVPSDVQKISFTVTIDQADVRNQNFGMVENAFIRLVDEGTGTELIRYDLTEDFSIETAIVVAELYRNNGEWKFNAVGSGFSGGLAALCGNFGINIG